jgi:molybdopterin synthase catalytic subunit
MIRLLREPIDLAALQASSPADGALCLFAGIVRNENKGKAVLYLEYEAYEDMALALMERIGASAEKWPITDLRMVIAWAASRSARRAWRRGGLTASERAFAACRS